MARAPQPDPGFVRWATRPETVAEFGNVVSVTVHDVGVVESMFGPAPWPERWIEMRTAHGMRLTITERSIVDRVIADIAACRQEATT